MTNKTNKNILEFFSVLKSIISESFSTFLHVMQIVLPFIDKLFYIVVKNILLVSVITLLTSTITYYITPSLFTWFLSKVGVSVGDLGTIQELIKSQEETESLKRELQDLQSKRDDLENRLNITEGRNVGILEGVRNIRFEQVNWKTVILTTSGITLVGLLFGYFIFKGDDGAFFKPVLQAISDNSTVVVKGVTSSSAVLNTNITALIKELQALDEKIDVLKNAIDLISRKKN